MTAQLRQEREKKNHVHSLNIWNCSWASNRNTPEDFSFSHDRESVKARHSCCSIKRKLKNVSRNNARERNNEILIALKNCILLFFHTSLETKSCKNIFFSFPLSSYVKLEWILARVQFRPPSFLKRHLSRTEWERISLGVTWWNSRSPNKKVIRKYVVFWPRLLSTHFYLVHGFSPSSH